MAFENWNGYSLERFTLCDTEAIVVRPKDGTANGKWALKTEYFGAFPDTELQLLAKGWHIAHIKTITRWYVPQDNRNKAALAQYMHEQLGLSKKCAIIGMSCGGMQGIYFASEHPELVSCLYLDAPVVNFLSIPGGLGKPDFNPEIQKNMYDEFYNATGRSIIDLLSYRDHPLDRIPALLQHRIPLIFVSGDADHVVNYEENGQLLQTAYEQAGLIIETHIKPGGDHHPHGLPDNTPIVDFIVKYSEDD